MPGKVVGPLDIWFVDDDPADVALFREQLAAHGFEHTMRHLPSGTELLTELASGARPHLIFLDLNMPGMDGQATLRAVRNDLRLDCHIIVLTSLPEADVMEDVMSAGSNYFIPKPTTPAEFTDAIQIVRDFVSAYVA